MHVCIPQEDGSEQSVHGQAGQLNAGNWHSLSEQKDWKAALEKGKEVEKTVPGSFPWSLMKSKLQFGCTAASFTLLNGFCPVPEGACAPTAVGQAWWSGALLRDTHPQHWGFHPAHFSAANLFLH